jgi:hypothetical protein
MYRSNVSMGCTLLLPIEILNTLRFQRFDNGYPVKVAFNKNSEDVENGTLTYTWARKIELEPNYKIYEISYPKSVTKDKP